MGDIVGVVFSSWALEHTTAQKEKQIGRMKSEHYRVTGKSRICHFVIIWVRKEDDGKHV